MTVEVKKCMKQSRVKAMYPYDGYYIYKVFHKGAGRNYANLVPIDKNNKKRKTISYARYLMSVKEGRILSKDEQVDHIDNDKSNDDINNLQILSYRENNIKEVEHKGIKIYTLKCPNCGKIFERKKRDTFLSCPKNSKFGCTFCSRSCSGQFSANVQFGNIDIDSDDVKDRIKNNVVSVRIIHDFNYICKDDINDI